MVGKFEKARCEKYPSATIGEGSGEGAGYGKEGVEIITGKDANASDRRQKLIEELLKD
jgi:hypothetical protein